jgi:hypothetical protein
MCSCRAQPAICPRRKQATCNTKATITARATTTHAKTSNRAFAIAAQARVCGVARLAARHHQRTHQRLGLRRPPAPRGGSSTRAKETSCACCGEEKGACRNNHKPHPRCRKTGSQQHRLQRGRRLGVRVWLPHWLAAYAVHVCGCVSIAAAASHVRIRNMQARASVRTSSLDSPLNRTTAAVQACCDSLALGQGAALFKSHSLPAQRTRECPGGALEVDTRGRAKLHRVLVPRDNHTPHPCCRPRFPRQQNHLQRGRRLGVWVWLPHWLAAYAVHMCGCVSIAAAASHVRIRNMQARASVRTSSLDSPLNRTTAAVPACCDSLALGQGAALFKSHSLPAQRTRECPGGRSRLTRAGGPSFTECWFRATTTHRTPVAAPGSQGNRTICSEADGLVCGCGSRTGWPRMQCTCVAVCLSLPLPATYAYETCKQGRP